MTAHPELTSKDLRDFGIDAPPQRLPGGSTAVWKVGNLVLKHISETSLENDHSPQLAGWIAEFSATLPQHGFRIPQGVPTADGRWITPEGWTAWTFVEGHHATVSDIPRCIAAIQSFHNALKTIPKQPLLDKSDTHWARAQRWCLGDQPEHIHPAVKAHVEKLYALRTPVESSIEQLVHGDLNPENIPIANAVPPAIIDLSPFWGPPELAMAIFSNFIGPRRGDPSALNQFKHLPNHKQWLLRAAIRMLLVISEGGDLQNCDTSTEKEAAEIVIAFVEQESRAVPAANS